MQHLLLYIEVNDSKAFNYEKPIFEALKREYPEADSIDVDNHSEALLIQHVMEILDKMDKIIVHVEVIENSSPSAVLKIINSLYKHKDKLTLTAGGKAYESLSRYINPLISTTQNS